VVLKLTGLDYLIRLDAVDLRYPGGREALVDENAKKIGRLAFYYDDMMILHTVVGISEFRLWDNYFEERGIELTEMHRGTRIAGDRVYNSHRTGWSEPCDWLGVNEWDLTCWYWKENYWVSNPLRDYYHPHDSRIIRQSLGDDVDGT